MNGMNVSRASGTPCVSVFGRLCVLTVECLHCRSDGDSESETTKLDLLPNERLESFWDALWVGIRMFLCLTVECLHCRSDGDSESDITKLDLLPNERLESFWDALWLGIRPFLWLIVGTIRTNKAR